MFVPPEVAPHSLGLADDLEHVLPVRLLSTLLQILLSLLPVLLQLLLCQLHLLWLKLTPLCLLCDRACLDISV